MVAAVGSVVTVTVDDGTTVSVGWVTVGVGVVGCSLTEGVGVMVGVVAVTDGDGVAVGVGVDLR